MRSVANTLSLLRATAHADHGLISKCNKCLFSTAMLPEAFEEGGDYAGLFTLLGFLASLFVKLTLEKKAGPGALCAHQCVGFFEEHEDLLLGSGHILPHAEPSMVP